MQQQYLSVKDVATRLGKSTRTIRDWIATGCPTPSGRVSLPAFRAGKGHLIDADDLDIFEVRLRRAGGRRDLDLS